MQPGFNPDRVMAIQTWLPGPNDPTYGYLSNRHAGIGLAARDSSPQPNPAGRRRSGDRRRGRSSPGPQRSQPAAIDPRRRIETMDNQAPLIDSPIVSPEYFHLLGMPLLRGRLFSDQDLEDYAPGCGHQSGRGSHLLAQSGPAWQTRPFAPGYPRAVELCQASLDHDRRRDCGCPHRIAGGRGQFRRSIAACTSAPPKK